MAAVADTVPAVDERLPLRSLLPLAFQHVVTMVATPISSVALIATALRLPAATTASLLAGVLVLCGLGSLLQSLGPVRWRIGARLPFVMLPGGAATTLFLQTAQHYGLATASGSVLLAAALLLAAVPWYARLVRLFPPLVMGVVVLLIGISMIKVSAQLLTTAPWLGVTTVATTALAFLLLRGPLRQGAILFGMAVGTAVAAATGHTHSGSAGPGWSLPALLPYGAPHFDLAAAIPLCVFSLASLAEITGQTVLNSETVGRTPDPSSDVPRTARADAVVSALGTLLGAPSMVTTSENIGVVRMTGVRSRYVTAAAGVLLVALGLLSPVTGLLSAIPAPVAGGSALVVFAVIAASGISLLHRVDLDGPPHSVVAALALIAGLLPVVDPGLYQGLPTWALTLLGTPVTAGTIAAVALHALFSVRSPAMGDRRCAPGPPGP